MTQDTFTPQGSYTIAGTGPYAVEHPFAAGEDLIVVAVNADEKQVLDDYTLSAATGPADLFLSASEATAYDGWTLYIMRSTDIQQGWTGNGGAREVGLEVQLDRLTMALQDHKERGIYVNDTPDALDARGRRLGGLADPVDPGDAASKDWLEQTWKADLDAAKSDAEAAAGVAQASAGTAQTAEASAIVARDDAVAALNQVISIVGGISAPDAFAAGDWILSNPATGGSLDVTIVNLPARAIDIEYSLDAAAWASTGDVVDFSLTGLADGQSYDVKLRARNLIGPSTDSDTKSEIPTTADIIAPLITAANINTVTDTVELTFDEDSLPMTVRWQVRPVADLAPDQTAMINNSGGEAGGSYPVAASPDSEAIDLSALALGDKTLYVLLEDAVGNYSFQIYAYDFTLIAPDLTAPSFVSGSPADEATDVAIDANIVLTFDENLVAAAAGGEFYLYDTSGPTLIETFDVDAGTGDNGGTITVSGTDVTLNPGANLANSTSYSTRWNAGAVEDNSGNGVAANTGDTLHNFTTVASAGFTFSLANSVADVTGHDPATETIVTPTEGNLLVAVVAERSGGDPANHTVTDNGTGTTWTRIPGLDIDNSVPGDESNTRQSQSVWWRKAVAIGSEASQVTADDGTTNKISLQVVEIAPSAAYDFVFADAAAAGSGAAHWDGQGSGNASPTGSDIFQLAIGTSRISTDIPTPAGMSFSAFPDGKVASVGAQNQTAIITAFKAASQAAGAVASTLTSDGTGCEGVVSIACWRNGA